MKIKLKGNYATRGVYLNDKILLPDKSQKIINHSPDGFSWSYGGSGPAQLALAILLELYDTNIAKSNYQDFKWKEIANLPKTDFEKEIEINY